MGKGVFFYLVAIKEQDKSAAKLSCYKAARQRTKKKKDLIALTSIL